MDETIYKRSKEGKEIKKSRKEKLQLTWKGKSLTMNKTITIGRDRINDIVIDDPLASRKHAIIEKIGENFFIKDLKSTNSTYVNNNPLRPGESKKLQPGSVITIGKCEFQII